MRVEQNRHVGVSAIVRSRSDLPRRVALGVVAFALLGGALSAGAKPSGAGQGLDLLVIVDRSASMTDWGTAKQMLHMTLDIMARNAESMRLCHRLGVIRFGSTVSVDMPLVAVGKDGLPRLHGIIDRLPPDVLGDTDILAAFAAALTMFRDRPGDRRSPIRTWRRHGRVPSRAAAFRRHAFPRRRPDS